MWRGGAAISSRPTARPSARTTVPDAVFGEQGGRLAPDASELSRRHQGTACAARVDELAVARLQLLDLQHALGGVDPAAEGVDLTREFLDGVHGVSSIGGRPTSGPRVRQARTSIGDHATLRHRAPHLPSVHSAPTGGSGDQGGVVAVTGLANLAVKVADLDQACDFYEAAGATVRDRMEWGGGERADVFLGPVMITLFTRAIYEDAVDLPAEGFLHPALFTDDLDTELEGHRVVWGPAVVEGSFGRRRIAFVDAPGGIRLEFMEQLEEPTGGPFEARP